MCVQGSQKDLSGGHSRHWCQFKCHSLIISLSQGNNSICAYMCKAAPFVLAKENKHSPNVNVKCYAAMGSVPIILTEKGRLENRMCNYFVVLGYLCICQSLSHVQLFAILWTIASQAPLSMKFSRQEYWSGLLCPSPRDLPNPGVEPRSPVLQADSLPYELPEKPQYTYTFAIFVCVCVCVFLII